ncbi:methyltransferase domain-containing protein [Pendulispora brunnea]|uniref:Methyltransferase domain-containing protein n=1 Tax=Pendulispora brunnea TaxID=2905690 RepID=A0ABZ2K8B5_9BACT
MAMVETTGRYTFDNDIPAAAEQLDHLAELLDPHSQRVLATTGVGPGWRCFDIGSGAGTIATWLATRVGANGRVVAGDLKPHHIPAYDCIEVRRFDVRTDEVPARAFDLIHARLVLMHLPEREHVLSRLVKALAPGGYLVISDFHWSTAADLVLHSPDPSDAELFDLFNRTLAEIAIRNGADLTWARRIHTVMRAAGLEEVYTAIDTQTWVGSEPGCLLDRVNSFQLEGDLYRAGMRRDQLERVRALLLNPDFARLSPLLFTSVGRK